MKKIVLSFAVLAALTSASFASQRSYDPERTLNGKALNSLIAKQSTLLGGPPVGGFSAGSAASAFAIDAPAGRSSRALDRMRANSYRSYHGDKQ